MDYLLWALQIILGIKYFTIAYSHGLRQDQEKMKTGIVRMGPVARPLLLLVAVVSLFVVAGLILPGVSSLPSWITPMAAAVLAAMNLLALLLHFRCRERPNVIPMFVLLVMSAFLAYGRWKLLPL